MSNLLQRLYRTKLALLATLFITSGIALLLCAAQWDHWTWLGSRPVADVGSALFTTGMLALVLEYFDSRDADERARESMRTVISEQAPALRDAVLDGFATQPERLTRIAAPETLERVIRNCLAARINDVELATGIYIDVQQQLANATDMRRYDAHVTITLIPWKREPLSGLGSMFVVTTRWQYRAHSLPAQLRFSAVSGERTYRN